ncbi:MAG: WG repeat-containing protein [Candidatus Limisoma sp.]
MNKFLVSAVALLLSSTTVAAQDLIPDQNEKGKWGYVNNANMVVIDYKYDSADFFMDGRAKVGKGGKYGYIDTNGSEIIKMKYNTIDKISDNVYKVSAGGSYKDGALLDEKYGFIDYSGKVLLEPKYETITSFKNGVALVSVDSKYGYINENFQIVVPCKFSAIGTFNSRDVVWATDGNKSGLYHKSGRVMIEPKYASVGTFTPWEKEYSKEELDKMTYTARTICKECPSHYLLRKTRIPSTPFDSIDGSRTHGYYFSGKAAGEKNSVVDLDGNVLIKEGQYYAAFYPTDGFAFVIKKANKTNYLNMTTGKMLLSKDITDGWAFHNGYAVAYMRYNKASLIDTNGREICSFDNIYPERGGVHIVSEGKNSVTYGLIDHAGNVLIEPTYNAIFPESEGLLAAQKSLGSKWGFLDNKGQFAILPTYENVFSFAHGLAVVKSKDKWGMIDPSGKEVVACKWNNISFLSEDNPEFVWVCPSTNEEGAICLDIKTNKQAFKGQYPFVRNFNQDMPGVAIVGKSSTSVGCIDKTGKVIIPLEMESGSLALKAYQQLVASGKPAWQEIDTYRFKLYQNDDRNKKGLNETIPSNLWDY